MAVTTSPHDGPVARCCRSWQGPRLIAHMAKANSQWRSIRGHGDRALVIVRLEVLMSRRRGCRSGTRQGGANADVAVHLAGTVSVHHDRAWLLEAVTDLTS